MGWTAQLPGMGDATGCWDLGRNGVIHAPLPATMSAPALEPRYIFVQVSMWLDGSIYASPATVSIPGATYLGNASQLLGVATVGGWIQDGTLWRVETGTAVAEATVTGAFNGSVVDKVVIETGGSSSSTTQGLMVQRVPGGDTARVQLTWSTDFTGYQLEKSSNLTDPQGWQAVSAPVESNGGLNSVTLDATEAQLFFRLKQP
jgi:hypothetical protein